MQRFKKPEFWAYPVLTVGLWAFFAFAMPDVLEFWEKNQLFRFSSDYWHFFDHEPFGTLIYVHTFLIQFSYYPWLGAIVYALLFTLTAWLFNRCFAINGNRRLLPGLLSVALLLPTTVNFGLLVLMVVFFASAGAHCWIYWNNRLLRYSCQVLVLAGLTYLVREYMVWILPFYMCLDWGRTRQSGQKFNLLFLLIPLVGTALVWGLETWFCAPYEFVVPQKFFQFTGQCFSPSYGIPYACFHIDNKVFIDIIAVLAAACLGFSFYQPKKQKFAWLIGLLLIIGGAWFTRIQAQPITDFQKVDKLCRAYRWNEALHQTNIQWEKTKSSNEIKDINTSKTLLCGQTRTTLLATRKATSTLFTYPHPYFPLLFPIDMINMTECFTLPPYYTYIGGISESLHIDYDYITAHNISANILNHVIMTSLIVDDTMPMLKFVKFLQHSLFYRNQAAIYLDPAARLKLPQVIRGKMMLPKHNYTVWGYNPDENALRQHLHQPDNIYFYEYYLAVSLLHKKHSVIKDEMPTIKRFYPHGGKYIAPRHIQEALLANYDYAPMRLAYPSYIEGVDNNTWRDYWRFLSDNEAFQSGKKNFSELSKDWGHTYWFYDCYMKIIHFNNTDSRQIN